MRYKNIILIGTSHISPESLKEVEDVINKYNPNIVALELDKQRLFALLNKTKQRSITLRDIRKVGVKGFLFSLVGAWVEKKLGEQVGVSPGSEMLKAYKIATQTNKQIALIDQNIEITLRRLSQTLTWREKWHFVVDAVKSLIKKQSLPFDISKVPTEKIIKHLLKEVKKRYPNIYKVLVQERNEFMAKKLAILTKQFSDKLIVAIIGAGHEREIIELIKKYMKTIDVV